MKNSDKAFVQAYNAQAAVDRKSQIIVAADLTNRAPDITHLPDIVKQIKFNLKRKPKKLLADAGHFNKKNVTFLERRRIDVYTSPDKQKHGATAEPAPRGYGLGEERSLRLGNRICQDLLDINYQHRLLVHCCISSMTITYLEVVG